ncbi:MAG TPA: hypothetical protein VF765_05260 [Polyangiaceae bacterium]
MKPRTASPARMACAVLLVAGCRQIVGIEDQPPGSGTAQVQSCASFSVGAAACNACMTSSCCAEEQQCAGEDAGQCSALVACFAQCKSGDAACASACRSQFSGDEAAAALRSCEASHCAQACGVDSCGGYVYQSAACAACGAAQCCTLARTCEEDAECARLTACEEACSATDADCFALCELAHPSAVDEERALGACTSAHCAASCIAPKWQCLEHPPTPPASPAVSVTLFFGDYMSKGGIPGLALRKCDIDDYLCDGSPTTPLATTNGYGQATLPLPAGFSGYIEVTGTSYGPFLLFLPHLSSDVQIGPIYLPNGTTVGDVEFALSVTQDTNKAIVIVVVGDCRNAAAGGVSLGITPNDGTTPYYFVGTLPSRKATQTDATVAAVGGFFNTQQGAQALVISATVVENSLTYPPRTILGRAGAISYVLMDASPL